MHSIFLNIFCTVSLITITTVWSKNVISSEVFNEIRNKRNTAILYPAEDSTHSESIQTSQWVKIMEKPDEDSNLDSETTSDAGILEGASSDLIKQEDLLQPQQQLLPEIQMSNVNPEMVEKQNNNQEDLVETILKPVHNGNKENQNSIQIVWLFPKRTMPFNVQTNDCRKSSTDVTNNDDDENRKSNNKNNNSIFNPICGYNGEEYFTFYNYCEFKTINECQNKSNSTDVADVDPVAKEDKWKIVPLRKCIDKYTIISIKKEKIDAKVDDVVDLNKENLQDNKHIQRHTDSELAIEDFVNEKINSFKQPDPKDPNKECGDGDEYRKDKETETKV